MDRHSLRRAGFVVVLFAVLIAMNVPSTLFTIFVIGIVPGTTVAIPAWFMLTIYPMLFVAIAYWLGRQTFSLSAQKKDVSKRPPVKAARRSQSVKQKAAAKRHARATA